MKAPVLLVLGAILHPGIVVRDTDGVRREPLRPAKGHLSALIFVTNDCPISNYYSHEIRRTCDEYAARGVGCMLVYTDLTMKDAAAGQHARDYGHGNYPKVVDRNRALVEATGVTVTPEVVVIRPDESIAYRGRIDNYYVDLTKPRAQATERDWHDALETVLAGKSVTKPEVQPVGCYIPDKNFAGQAKAPAR
jgi:hypothetical protein